MMDDPLLLLRWASLQPRTLPEAPRVYAPWPWCPRCEYAIESPAEGWRCPECEAQLTPSAEEIGRRGGLP